MTKGKNKKFLSVLLTLGMVVSLFAGLTVSASATDDDYWTRAPFTDGDGYYMVYYETSWIGGSSHTVTTAAQLASVPLVMAGTAYHTDSTGHLLSSSGNYITNMSDATLLIAYDSGMNITLGANFSVGEHYWTPIGTSTRPYCCTFDGAGYTISGLRISSTASNQGLFGVISSAATVKNLTVSSPSVTGGKNIGAVVGLSYGTVQNCTAGSTGNLWISGTNNVSSACIGAGVGGVVGGSFGANSKVLNCTNYAMVNGTSTNTYTGGVVGKAEGTVTGCANHRSVTGVNYAGGVIGYLSSTGYYNTTDTNDGTVTCTASSGTHCGPIVGYSVGTIGDVSSHTFTDSNYETALLVSRNMDIAVNTAHPVTIKGNGTNAYAVSITCSVAANITIENLRVSSPTTASGNIINFASGTSNSLVLTGTNLMENDNYSLSGAVIRVPSGSTLNISGSGTLYLYKNSMGAGIGSNANEASGVINFNHTGTILTKGSKTGPTIGGDTGVGNITINSGILNVETNARGAGIGGSNQCNGGIVSITGGNVYVTCDFSGHAIGSGASASNGGTLYISGGSLQTRHTDNSPLTDSTIINAAIRYGTPASYSTSGSAYTLDLAGTSFENGEFTVTTGSSTATTQVNHWYYTPSTSSTMANWSYITSGTNYNSTVTLYVPSGTTYVTLSKTSGAESIYILEDTTWTSAVTRASGNSDYLFHVATGKVLTLGSGASITGNGIITDVYLANDVSDDTYMSLIASLSGALVVKCANPDPDDATRIAMTVNTTAASAAAQLIKYYSDLYEVTSQGLFVVLSED